jgi:hypothetical protein
MKFLTAALRSCLLSQLRLQSFLLIFQQVYLLVKLSQGGHLKLPHVLLLLPLIPIIGEVPLLNLNTQVWAAASL